MSRHPTLSILQHNTMKSRDKVMASLLRDKRIIKYDILAIQEPWRNPFMNTTHNPIPQHFELAYHNHRKTRVCFFINKRIGSSQWSVTHHTPDLSTLELRWGRRTRQSSSTTCITPSPPLSQQTVLSQHFRRQWADGDKWNRWWSETSTCITHTGVA